MHKKILGTLAAVGLIAAATTGLMVGTSTIASASPATSLLGGATTRATGVDHVDYYWNRRHYAHRSWNKAARRWRYY